MQDIGIATSYDRGDFTPLFYHDKCDKYDYLTAIGCGAVAGIVDIFLVGAPGENKIPPMVRYTSKPCCDALCKKMRMVPSGRAGKQCTQCYRISRETFSC